MKILITGVAGFIGFHTAIRCIKKGMQVIGIDNMSDYYDVTLKKNRLGLLEDFKSEMNGYFDFRKLDIEDKESLFALFKYENFDYVCNFAGQAGVRYSIDNPQIYISTNIQGFFNLIDCSVKHKIKRFIYASSSSVYGANDSIPYKETDQTDQPVSIYAATKKANELIAHSYSSIYGMPTIGLRFFTVYGPWGRPDMSPFIFTKAIKDGLPLHVFNEGKMLRDFTYIDDITEAIYLIISKPNKSTYEIYNIGHSTPIEINLFIKMLEYKIGKQVNRINLPMQPGDMLVTCSDTSKLMQDYNYQPHTSLDEGITNYLAWYDRYYQ